MRVIYRKLGLLCGVFAISIAISARAEIVPELYSVGVPVAEQNQSELQRAAATGLRELAVRISGRSGAGGDPALAPMFANAMRYLDQYRYERNTSGESAWLAQLHFAPALIDSELRKAGAPVWGGNRPALRAIILSDDNGARALVDENSLFANTLRQQWHRRGLVLHLPQNSGAIDSDDVARFDFEKVAAQISERGDGLVLGRIALSANGACESHWQLALGAQVFAADATGSNSTACIANGLDRLVDGFSAQYAIAANSSAEGLILRVSGITRFDDYAALLNYLRRLAAIKNAQPVVLNNDEVLLQLKVEGSTEQLTRQFALESRLAPIESAANSALPAALNYRWSALRN